MTVLPGVTIRAACAFGVLETTSLVLRVPIPWLGVVGWTVAGAVLGGVIGRFMTGPREME